MNARSDLQLMHIQVVTLFDCDADGRLQYVREPGSPYAPPRFFMGRTLQGNIWRFRHDLAPDLIRDLEQLCRSEPVAEDLTRPPHTAAAIRAALHAHAPITAEECGPAYLIPEQAATSAEVVLITKANAHLLQAGFAWKLRQMSTDIDIGPIAAVVAQGSAVSICYCARLSPVAAEAGVETLDAMVGRGYASAAVAGWAAAIRQRGLLPLYSTSWENLASQGVARKLGMARYGEDWLID